MRRFLKNSPVRGWRCLYTFLGLLVSATAIYVLIDWPLVPPKDMPMLVFQTILLVSGLALLYLGVLANDERIVRFTEAIRRWSF